MEVLRVPLGILVVTLLTKESIGHSLKFEAFREPNSAPSRIFGLRLALGIAHSHSVALLIFLTQSFSTGKKGRGANSGCYPGYLV